MQTPEYRQFIDEVCKLVSLSSPEALYDQADLAIDGVDFLLTELIRGDDIGVCIQCDFGMPPSSARVVVLERLLEFNLLFYNEEPLVFGMHEETGHIVMHSRIGLRDRSALDILNALAKHAACAKEWRTNFLLHPAKGTVKSLTARDPRFSMPA